MGLKHKAKTMVGGTLPGGLMLRGLSGGERKRLSIAAGILAAPSIVFLDEPTSGLDSFAALTVMGHLKRMARDNGHVVIASIHQPRSAIWSMFDRVSEGAVVVVVVVLFVAPTMQPVRWHVPVVVHSVLAGCACSAAYHCVCAHVCVNGLPMDAKSMTARQEHPCSAFRPGPFYLRSCIPAFP